ncbi:hypothetical protein C1646_765160 [Rhizophagus diaphanus]|nr:hypothetical protein C1646_765160 [Rhizophagus diaphanus] [Rhizophagus sp. MUCL 43196]
MACSKIFSVDLPELTEEIMKYFRKDFSTLYSCILVNRLWCRLAIPLLWEDPFSAPDRNYHCIKTYFCFSSEDSKAKFNEYEINDNLLFSNTLFNYPSFIKYLDIKKFCYSIKDWGDTLGDKYNLELGKLIYRNINFGFGYLMSEEYNESKQQLFEFIMKYCKKIRYFKSGIPNYDNIYLFIENNQHNNINYLTIEVDHFELYTIYYKLCSTVLQNLGQVLPFKLEYLCLTLSFKASNLEIFLNNSQNTFIKKLLIRNIVVMGFNDNVDEYDLFSLKDEVNEFKLHNIIVQSYYDLHISEHDYINNHLQY